MIILYIMHISFDEIRRLTTSCNASSRDDRYAPPPTPDRRLGVVWSKMNAWLEKGVTPATNVLESIDRIPFFLTLATVLFFYPHCTHSTLIHPPRLSPRLLYRSFALALFHFVVAVPSRPHTQKTMYKNSDHQSYYFQLSLIYDIK